MSATGRTPGVRVAFDGYATPHWCVDRLLEAVALPGGDWLEPCAGEGGIIAAVGSAPSWTACELQSQYEAGLRLCTPDVQIGDFLAPTYKPVPLTAGPVLLPRRPYRVAITNPPYALAQEFIVKCRNLADITIMLLRINFLGTQTRMEWMRDWVPDIYVLPERPSFDGKGTDATEYAWMAWDWRRVDGRGKLIILGSTPAEVRATENKRRRAARALAAMPG
jgi:hypothetical protein